MVEIVVVVIFIACILTCILSGLSIVYALAAGLLLFALYGRTLGYSFSDIADMIISGVRKTNVMLISFMMIGILSALWRASGTIAVIVCFASDYITPSVFFVMTWLLCSLISFLLGSSFGTAATMGVVCMMMAKAIGADIVLSGGAILGGCYFGDRCSPVSPSALIKSRLTDTDIYKNISLMLRSNFIPFLISTMLYVLLGRMSSHSGMLPNIREFFGKEFTLSAIAVIPALLILLLALFRMKARYILLISSIIAALMAFFLQGLNVTDILRTMIFGYTAKTDDLAAIVNGGGVISMARAACILVLSSGQAGIFNGIGMFSGAKDSMNRVKEKYTPFTSVLLTSIVTSLICCAETPAMFIVLEICDFPETDKYEYVMMIEDSIAYVAALVPWGILAAVPLATIGAPNASILLAFNLYLLPICSLIASFIRKRNLRSISRTLKNIHS